MGVRTVHADLFVIAFDTIGKHMKEKAVEININRNYNPVFLFVNLEDLKGNFCIIL